MRPLRREWRGHQGRRPGLLYPLQDTLPLLRVGETTTEENGLDIRRAFDTIYGFILGQEVHVRAELFQSLDVLYYWARKAETAVPGADSRATGAAASVQRCEPVSGATKPTESGETYDAEKAEEDKK